EPPLGGPAYELGEVASHRVEALGVRVLRQVGSERRRALPDKRPVGCRWLGDGQQGAVGAVDTPARELLAEGLQVGVMKEGRLAAPAQAASRMDEGRVAQEPG